MKLVDSEQGLQFSCALIRMSDKRATTLLRKGRLAAKDVDINRHEEVKTCVINCANVFCVLNYFEFEQKSHGLSILRV